MKNCLQQGLGETDGKGSILMGAIKPVENNIQQQEQPAKEKEKDVPLKVRNLCFNLILWSVCYV